MKALHLKLKSLLPTEDDECVSLLQWAAVTRYKGLRLSDHMVMLPNRVKLTGDARARAITMNAWKRTGFKAGASDYFLAIPTERYPGLWLEMKRTKLSVTTDEQTDFQDRMRKAGYFCGIAKGFDEAKAMIEEYLG